MHPPPPTLQIRFQTTGYPLNYHFTTISNRSPRNAPHPPRANVADRCSARSQSTYTSSVGFVYGIEAASDLYSRVKPRPQPREGGPRQGILLLPPDHPPSRGFLQFPRDLVLAGGGGTRVGFPATEEHVLLFPLGKRGKVDPSARSRTHATGGTHVRIPGSHVNTVTRTNERHTLSQTHRDTDMA